MPEHISVMPTEVLHHLDPNQGELAVDGTLGLAGHALLLTEKLGPAGLLVGLDWDPAMLELARTKLRETTTPHELYHADYRELSQCLLVAAGKHGREPQADIVLLDLGLSNVHLESDRGFTFRVDGPLDMRMDSTQPTTAASLLNSRTPAQIEQALLDYGDERWARKIAQIIVERRPLHTTQELVDCVLAAIPPRARDKRIHPATRTMQAVRIWTNRELEGLEDAIADAAHALAPGGRMVVLAYHSGEDRAVKHAFRSLGPDFTELTRKPLTPSEAELRSNPKSRSAKLRAIRREPR